MWALIHRSDDERGGLTMARVLLVDDQPSMLLALQSLLQSNGHETVEAGSGREALAQLEGIDAVITDYSMQGMDGLQLLQAIRERDELLPVVFLTAHGSERLVVRAMKAGAYDYIVKPPDDEEVLLVVERALEERAMRIQNRQLTAEKALGHSMIASSAAMRHLLDEVARVGPKDITVLVRGETGTGKELIASLIQAHSKRASAPMVRFNCAAIPGELAEAQLFGHTRGAFTGASQASRGFVSEADGGTLVLDEVGELPSAVQAKLLRTLQEGEIQPLGTGRVEKVDVRVVACTNRDLEAEARAGRFRMDLYYRLAVVELVVPPLREHREDIPALAAEFARRYGARFGNQDVRLSRALIDALCLASWPGNVRQLENAVARMVALGTGNEIGVEAFDTSTPETSAEPLPEGRLSLAEQVEALERSLIAKTMKAVSGNQSEAARRLGLGRSTLIDRLKRYGFHNPSEAMETLHSGDLALQA
jgi:two-component system response regulator AtoC